jgi:hypothetical protein
MPSALTRAFLGLIAAQLSVLVFHQTAIELFHLAGMGPRGWSMQPVPPFNVPKLADLCFWGGLYGAAFGLLLPRIRLPFPLAGILLGCVAALVGGFIVAPLKGLPLAWGGELSLLLRSFSVNGAWGLGVGLLLPLLLPRPLSTARFGASRVSRTRPGSLQARPAAPPPPAAVG